MELPDGPTSPGLRALLAAAGPPYVAAHYAPLTANLPVEVRWIDARKGRGLFAKRRLRMFQPIFSETPLVSLRKLLPEAPDACARCMRTFASKQAVAKTRFAPTWNRVYPPDGKVPSHVWCKSCELRKDEMLEMDPTKVRDAFLRGNPFFLERYCSEECRDAAALEYHLPLCGADFVSDESRVHPMHHLYNLCKETGSTRPLLVARMFAMVCQRVVVRNMTPEEAMQDFRNFATEADPSPADDMAVFLLKNIFIAFPFMDTLINLTTYRRFETAILRNAQTVTPVSDVHMWFERALQSEEEEKSGALLKELGFTPDSLKAYMATPEMLGLSKVEGFAMLPVGNCMNHSCNPNVIASSSHNDHTATFVALHQIEEGEELFISYVDDNLEWEERQRLLKRFYNFDCDCIRCHVQKEKIPIIE